METNEKVKATGKVAETLKRDDRPVPSVEGIETSYLIKNFWTLNSATYIATGNLDI